MDKIRIREGGIKDLPQIKKCLIDSWVDHARKLPELFDEERMRNSDIDSYYRKAFSNPNVSSIFVAEADGKFAGFIRADIQEIESFFKNNKILYLDDVYVLPKYRKTKVATLLTKEVEKKARELGIKSIQARIYTFNTPAQGLLKSFGYSMPYSTWNKII